MKIRSIEARDGDWVRELLCDRWGAPEVVTRGCVHRADRRPGFVAVDGRERLGLITYSIEDRACEIVSLDSLYSGRGIGSALVGHMVKVAREKHCRRVWLITTNDNTGALRFYQKIGFDLVTIHHNAIATSRRLKPSIPLKGIDDIPIDHEIELEIRL